MILQALPDVNMTLFNTLSNKINFTLESSHGWHKLSKCSFLYQMKEAQPVMMMQLLVGELVEAKEYRLKPHAAIAH